jgi:hypothetical protein
LWSLCEAGSDWFLYDGDPDPQFNPFGFKFLGPHEKCVYEVEINTEDQLRERIADAANQIRNNPEMLNSVYENFAHTSSTFIYTLRNTTLFIIHLSEATKSAFVPK